MSAVRPVGIPKTSGCSHLQWTFSLVAANNGSEPDFTNATMNADVGGTAQNRRLKKVEILPRNSRWLISG